MTPSPLTVVGHINIPPAAVRHRFIAEALSVASVLAQREEEGERVIGTANEQHVELYGWAPTIQKHHDSTGFIYLAPIVSENSFIGCLEPNGEEILLTVQIGDVIRLWDYADHWTYDTKACIAAFLGPFETPQDQLAIDAIRRGVDALAQGLYADAPRIRDGFRVVSKDECIVAADDFLGDTQIMLRKEARATKKYIITCSECGKYASQVDEKFPHFFDLNRCVKHATS